MIGGIQPYSIRSFLLRVQTSRDPELTRFERIKEAIRYLFLEAGVQVVEVIAAGVLIGIALQLARDVDTFETHEAFRLMSHHLTEGQLATTSAAVAAVPVVAFWRGSVFLRWVGLLLEVGFFVAFTLDTFAASPDGLMFLFSGALFFGCALGSFRLSPLAMREVLRESKLWYRKLHMRFSLARSKLDSRLVGIQRRKRR